MSTLELDEFYATDYRRIYQGDEGPTQKDLNAQKGRAESLLKFVNASVNEVGRHLDIGCSTGTLLTTFSEHYGNQPIGVEPGDTYRTYAQAQGLTVYKEISDLQTAAERRCDLISMAHVLEHLANPVGYLTYLREKYLTRDGWLLVEVPNLYCHDSFEIAHLISFSLHTLRQTFQRASFEIIQQEAHGRPRSELLPLYFNCISTPWKSSGSRSTRKRCRP